MYNFAYRQDLDESAKMRPAKGLRKFRVSSDAAVLTVSLLHVPTTTAASDVIVRASGGQSSRKLLRTAAAALQPTIDRIVDAHRDHGTAPTKSLVLHPPKASASRTSKPCCTASNETTRILKKHYMNLDQTHNMPLYMGTRK